MTAGSAAPPAILKKMQGLGYDVACLSVEGSVDSGGSLRLDEEWTPCRSPSRD